MTGPVLVTGAAGFVGTHLVELLRHDSVPMVGWRRPGVPHDDPAAGIHWMEIELLDRQAIAAALATLRPSAIYHLAGAAHVGQSWQNARETYEGNVLVTHHLFEALRAIGLTPRVLVAGSATIYRSQAQPIREGDALGPTSPYATSKLAQEMLAVRVWIEDGLPTLIARSFNHVGPRQDPSYVAPSIARQIALAEIGRLEPVLTMGRLDPKRDLTDVRDTVRAYVAMMSHGRPGVPYNVSSGRAVAIGELVETFVSRAHRRVRVVEDPSRFRPDDPPLLVGDHSRLTADTGWQPRIPFEQTVDDLLAYWRERVQREEAPS